MATQRPSLRRRTDDEEPVRRLREDWTDKPYMAVASLLFCLPKRFLLLVRRPILTLNCETAGMRRPALHREKISKGKERGRKKAKNGTKGGKDKQQAVATTPCLSRDAIVEVIKKKNSILFVSVRLKMWLVD